MDKPIPRTLYHGRTTVDERLLVNPKTDPPSIYASSVRDIAIIKAVEEGLNLICPGAEIMFTQSEINITVPETAPLLSMGAVLRLPIVVYSIQTHLRDLWTPVDKMASPYKNYCWQTPKSLYLFTDVRKLYFKDVFRKMTLKIHHPRNGTVVGTV